MYRNTHWQLCYGSSPTSSIQWLKHFAWYIICIAAVIDLRVRIWTNYNSGMGAVTPWHDKSLCLDCEQIRILSCELPSIESSETDTPVTDNKKYTDQWSISANKTEIKRVWNSLILRHLYTVHNMATNCTRDWSKTLSVTVLRPVWLWVEQTIRKIRELLNKLPFRPSSIAPNNWTDIAVLSPLFQFHGTDRRSPVPVPFSGTQKERDKFSVPLPKERMSMFLHFLGKGQTFCSIPFATDYYTSWNEWELTVCSSIKTLRFRLWGHIKTVW